MATLREDRDYFEGLFQSKAVECGELSKTNAHLKELVLVCCYIQILSN